MVGAPNLHTMALFNHLRKMLEFILVEEDTHEIGIEFIESVLESFFLVDDR
jgi:hypothetical protein